MIRNIVSDSLRLDRNQNLTDSVPKIPLIFSRLFQSLLNHEHVQVWRRHVHCFFKFTLRQRWSTAVQKATALPSTSR